MWQNTHFIRTKFINSIYEIIFKYIEKYEKLCAGHRNKSYLRKLLQSENWYRMLYLLRNNASHSDNLHTKVKFTGFIKELNQPRIEWKNLVVEDGMFGHKIRYNDEDLNELYNEIYNYVATNYQEFYIQPDGTIIEELRPYNDGHP